MLKSLVALHKLYHKTTRPGLVICGVVAALLTLPDSVYAVTLAAIAPPARKSNAVKILSAKEPKILTAIFLKKFPRRD